MKTKAASDVTVEDAVIAKLAQLQRQHQAVRFVKIVSTAQNTRDGFTATVHTLLKGMLLAAICQR